MILLLSLAPLPHAAMLSNHTWRVEFATAFFLIAVVAIGRRAIDAQPSQRTWIPAAVAVFAAWGLISAVWARSPASAWHHTIVWGEYLILFILLLSIGAGRRRMAIRMLSIVACFIAAVAVIDHLFVTDFNAVEGTLRMRYGAYGELLVTGVPLLWMAAAYRRTTTSWLVGLIPGAAGWAAAMLSLSKGVFIAGVIGCFLAFVSAAVADNGRRRRVIATAGMWVLLTVFVQFGSSYLAPAPATIDYLSGKADATRETSLARVFMWKVAAVMARDNLLLGVGADNFGIEFNNARANYRLSHPLDPATEINSDYLIERAHNEVLQIGAELGIFGLVLLATPFLVFVWLSASRFREGWRPGLLYLGCVGGMTAFAISSMVSSFSFRIMQNGVVFFIVFALAIGEALRKERRKATDGRKLPLSLIMLVFLMIAAFTLCMKAAAEFSFAAGDRESDLHLAMPSYQWAFRLDPDYAAALYRIGGRGCDAGYENAAANLRRSIDNGMGIVITYSQLSDCYLQSGDRRRAMAALEEGLRIFPRSVFLHVRYALLLDQGGDHSSSEAELAAARQISTRETNGWLGLITRGSVATFYAAQVDANIAPPAELSPPGAVLLYLDKPPGELPP